METENRYNSMGYADRSEYFDHLSERYDVEIETVEFTANLLGEDKDFDMLPAMLEGFYVEDYML